MIARVRSSRPLQVLLGLVLVAGLSFAWWAISPLFIATNLVEQSTPAQAALAPGGPARLIARGELQKVDDTHQGSGPVQIIELEGRRYLRFQNVTIQNGPDLHVYLGRGTGGAYDGGRDHYLGVLKATTGTFAYEIPASVRVEDHRSVVVWCRIFSVLFTYADLTPADR